MKPGVRLRARWCDFWFRPAALLDLGVARIVLAAIVLRLNGSMRFLPIGLISPDLWKPLPWIAALGFDQRPSLEQLMVFRRLSHAALLAVALGLLTHAALAIAFVLQLLQEAFLNCFGKTSHGTLPLLYAMLFFALAPCDRAVSLDALLRHGWRRVHRFWHRTHPHRPGHRRRQGLHDTRRFGSVPDRTQ